jgi:hypothetical protein
MTEKTARGRTAVSNSASKKIRVTMIIPYDLDRNVEAYSVREGLRKTEVVAAALSEFLHKRELRPDKPPKISIYY